MPRKVWTIPLEDGSHTIELDHGAISGRRSIRVDGELVERSRHHVDFGSSHTFELSGHLCEVVIDTNGLTFSYFLLVDGKPPEDDLGGGGHSGSDDLLVLRPNRRRVYVAG